MDDWWKNRVGFYDDTDLYEHEVSIAVVGYNRLEDKTRNCVESILRYTGDIDYELILVDSGSEDGTYEYFLSIEKNAEHKGDSGKSTGSITAIQIKNNKGLAYALSVAWKLARGRYLAFVANDCIVTTGWLENLLKCIKSDRRIGMVCPMASNVSNNQSVDIGRFSTWDEMQKLAEKFNQSDENKWEYRPRLINPVALYRAEIFDAIGYMDPGFVHDFGEDDMARAMHRVGYRLILCGDTYIEHNHTNKEKNSEDMSERLEIGRKAFVEKYHGIDPWDDVNNYISDYIQDMNLGLDINLTDTLENSSTGISDDASKVKILGVNIRCGTPFLDLCNHLKKRNIKNIELYAYTEDIKYYPDLVAYPSEVLVGKIEDIDSIYDNNLFDIVVTTDDLVRDKDGLLSSLKSYIKLVKQGGYLLFPVKNQKDILYFINKMLDDGKSNNSEDHSFDFCIDDVLSILEKEDISMVRIYDEVYQDKLKDALLYGALYGVGKTIFSYAKTQGIDDLNSLFVQRYWMMASK